MRLVPFLALTGCSFGLVNNTPCTSNQICADAFGPGSTCDDGGFCIAESDTDTDTDSDSDTDADTDADVEYEFVVINELLASNDQTIADEDGQFDDCDLTFRELTQVEDAIISRVSAIHHGRISYPTGKPDKAEEDGEDTAPRTASA